MSIKDQVSPEQWKALFNAPAAAATYVSMASGGKLEMFSEMLTAGKFLRELAEKESGTGYGELVDDLLAAMKGMSTKEVKAGAMQFQSKDPEGLQAEVKQAVADGGAVAADLPGGDGYKRWLLDMAREVAKTKTGGFLGIGSKSVVDEKEKAALDELAVMLGV